MPFIPTANGASAEIRMLVDGQRVENVLHFLGEDTYNATTLEELGSTICASWIANMLPLQTADLSLREVYLTDISDAAGPVATFATGLPASGSGTGLGTPNNVSLALSFRTAARGRSYRGRVYPAGMLQANVVNSQWDDVYAAAWLSAFQQLKIDTASIGSVLSVLSLRNAGNPRVAGVLTPITDIVLVDLVVDSQRRRLPGRGA